jgi:hypothetical protein
VNACVSLSLSRCIYIFTRVLMCMSLHMKNVFSYICSIFVCEIDHAMHIIEDTFYISLAV